MNLEKLKNAEEYFLELYPEGFKDIGHLSSNDTILQK